MTNKVVILITFIGLSLFTSCQKEKISSEPILAQVTNDLETPEVEELSFKSEVINFEKTFQNAKNHSTLSPKRWPIETNTTARNQETLACGKYIKGTTRNGVSNFGNSIYEHFGVDLEGNNFNGNDTFFVFKVEKVVNQKFILDAHSPNLSLFLFKIEENCFDGSCSRTLIELVGHSINKGEYRTSFTTPALSIGLYMILVDAPEGASGDFAIDRICDKTSSICILEGVDTFSDYQDGDLCEQSCHWSKWNADAAFDAVVMGQFNNYVKVKRLKRVPNADQPDILLHTDNGQAIKHIEFRMWIPSNRSAHFNLQKQLTLDNERNEVGAAVYFRANGKGHVYINNRIYPFKYQSDTWLTIIIDAHNDFQDFLGINIDNQLVAEFLASWNIHEANGSTKLQAINFYPYASDALFYLDNVSLRD